MITILIFLGIFGLLLFVCLIGIFAFPRMRIGFGIAMAVIFILALILSPKFLVTPFEEWYSSLQVTSCESCESTIPSITPTDEPVSCIPALVVSSQTHGDKVEANLNNGDSFDYSLTIVNPDTPTGLNSLVVLTEPGHIFDVTYKTMYFTSFRLRGTLDEVLCSVYEIAMVKDFTYVFVGDSETPEGWSTVDIKGWWTELVEKQYSEPSIDTGGDEWLPYFITAEDKDRDIKSDKIISGQFWNSNYSGVVVHVQVEAGYTLKVVPDWQGTYWEVPENASNIQDRIVQASKEVLERDKLYLGNMTFLYCGDPANMPTTKLVVGSDSLSWTSELKFWDCKVNN